MEQLTTLLNTYTENYLDGGYFNIVLSEYEGLIDKPLHIHISEYEDEEPKVKIYGDLLNREDISLPLDSQLPLLIRVIIRVKNEERQLISRHSNLIIIDSNKKRVYRFEPMYSDKYRKQVNHTLKNYFTRYLPDYKYKEMKIHSEGIILRGKGGMCVTYVIKAAVLYLLTGGIKFPGTPAEIEKDITSFAAAIMRHYPQPLKSDVEFGFGDWLSESWERFKDWSFPEEDTTINNIDEKEEMELQENLNALYGVEEEERQEEEIEREKVIQYELYYPNGHIVELNRDDWY
jgi:hypothetical protein